MRIRAVVALAIALATVACSGTSLFRQYEYEEEIYLSLDGTATVYVNTSIPALNALRGTSFNTSPNARVDRDAIRALYSSPTTHVVWVRESRRNGRRFAHVRLEADDITKLSSVPAFAWSTPIFRRDGDEFVFRDHIAAAANRDVGNVGWTGRELTAFRLHLPSKITYHPKEIDIRRGNILAWEQPLTDRLKGLPLDIDVRMQTQSILYRTLWLFAATFVVVVIGFVAVIWWVLRRGARHAETV
ncbi:MAG TPA: hypothetical protein VFA59_13760 [Vicinamibacterales bacterium]|nr:hypothetical protein [Vicinamibacterales bacterium]